MLELLVMTELTLDTMQCTDDFGYIEYGDASNYNGWDMVGGGATCNSG